VLPLRDIVVFPHMIVPLFVGREKSIRALEEVMKNDALILLATQKNASDDDPSPDSIYEVGTLASVLQLLKLPDGTVKVLVEGWSAHAVQKYSDRSEYYEATAVALADTDATSVEAEALARSVVSDFESYVKLNKKVSPEVVGVIQQIEDYAKLADTVASHLAVKISDKQEILETQSVTQRLEKVLGLMESEISVLQVEKRIRTRVKRQMEKTQREYYLNEQMKAIQKELGDEEGRDELQELEDKIKKTKLSKEAREKATHELKKLRQMSPMSAEATVVRNYLDWLLSIPWNKKSKVKKDLNLAEQILDADHYGLEKVKERIVEYLAGPATGQQADRTDPLPRRTSRRGQDLARQVDRQGDRPRIRARVARRRAGRGGNPRSPAHLYRLDAWKDHPVDAQGQDLKPALPAGRGRQDGRRFPRRSVVGFARGARS
jgi:ATP-dependent Lon protease